MKRTQFQLDKMTLRSLGLGFPRYGYNKVRGGLGESRLHFLVKAAVCKLLEERHRTFFTEFPIHGPKADIFDLTNRTVIEIESSPTEQKKKEKLNQFNRFWIQDLIIINLKEVPKEVDGLFAYLEKKVP